MKTPGLVMLVIGESGTGKSTLCNVMAGEMHNSKHFPVSTFASGRTHCTFIDTKVCYNGDNSKPCTIIDTQGFNDPGKVGSLNSEKNHEIIHELLIKLTKISHVNLFVICVSGINVRVHESLRYMMTMFKDIFGQKMENNEVVKDENIFWERCVIVYTHLPMDESSIARRALAREGDHNFGLTDEVVLSNNIKELKRIIGIGEHIKLEYLVIDAIATRFKSDSTERIKFNNECLKLYEYLSEKSPAMTEAMTKANVKISTRK